MSCFNVPECMHNFFLDMNLLKRVNNNPVHILNSPSAFIPFCSLGEDILGVKVKEFEIPVCNIFEPKIQYDQFCYETNLDLLKKEDANIRKKQREIGLILVLDYNEERQLDINKEMANFDDKTLQNSVSIYLNSIGIYRLFSDLFFITPPRRRRGVV